MKKITLFALFLMLISIIFIVPASAERFTNQPVTLAIAVGNEEAYLTITDVEIVTPYYYVESEGYYAKNIGVYIDGTVSRPGAGIDIIMHCYNKDGQFIDSYSMGFVAESDTFKGQFVDVLIGAPMETASVEFEARNPGSWNNSYYYCRYENVYADDGRVIGVHDLLVPNYELVGWHGNVELYSLDGRTIEVPYPEVSAYKKVGWYDWDERAVIYFRDYTKEYFETKDYDDIIDEANWLIERLESETAIAEVKAIKKQAIDEWKKSENGAPLDGVYDIIYNEDGTADIKFWMYNLSDKPIVAFKMEFACCNIFGEIVEESHIYYSDDEYIEPGQCSEGVWSLDSAKTDHIRNYKLNQVVFSDRTSWYR